jgi:hypothetical protein
MSRYQPLHFHNVLDSFWGQSVSLLDNYSFRYTAPHLQKRLRLSIYREPSLLVWGKSCHHPPTHEEYPQQLSHPFFPVKSHQNLGPGLLIFLDRTSWGKAKEELTARPGPAQPWWRILGRRRSEGLRFAAEFFRSVLKEFEKIIV